MSSKALRLGMILVAGLMMQASAWAQAALINYTPPVRDIEGEQPFTYSYSISIGSIFFTAQPGPLTVPLEIISLARPDGVSEATALSFISLSQNTLSFSGAAGLGAPQNLTVNINVPEGFSAGDYAYRIKTGAWPGGLLVGDNGTMINMRVIDPGAVALPPVVTITSPADQSHFTYNPLEGPLVVPFTFEATSEGTFPILNVDADLNNTAVATTATGLGTNTVNASGSLTIISGGLYTLRARASNAEETSADSIEFTVDVVAPPPTIAVVQPSNNASYTYTLGGPAVQVPVNFTVNSLYGGITAVGATLNGSPLTNLTVSGLGTLQATGSATLNITTPGAYTLVYSGSTAAGSAAPKTVNFTVTGAQPLPTVTITQPAPGLIVNRTTGSPASQVPFTFQATTTFGTIQSVTVTLNGTPVSATVGGLGTANATGSGTLSVTTSGSYTLAVTASNGAANASDARSFAVVETAPPPPASKYKLSWQPPISQGKTIEGGTVMPIKFTLEQNGKLVSDQSVVIAVYEIFSNGSSSEPVLYPYGTGSPAPPDYVITSKIYHLDFPTAKGTHRYKVEVYSSSATGATLLGTNEILTKGSSNSKSDKSCKSEKSKSDKKSDKKSSKDSKSGKSDKSDKSSKSGKDKDSKSGKSSKSDKSSKSSSSKDKSDKSDKNDKNSKDSKNSKSDKSGKSDKNSKSDKSSKSGSKKSK